MFRIATFEDYYLSEPYPSGIVPLLVGHNAELGYYLKKLSWYASSPPPLLYFLSNSNLLKFTIEAENFAFLQNKALYVFQKIIYNIYYLFIHILSYIYIYIYEYLY